jgi:hypothetical protein
MAFGVGALLTAGCATQQQTAQALTVGGAAAVLVGASMAADEQCYAAGSGEGGLAGDCVSGFSKGTRTAGKGLALAGVGVAAAGYALTPKGPDRRQPTASQTVPNSPYRLIRSAPPEPETSAASPEPLPGARPAAAAAPVAPAPASGGPVAN